MKRFTTLTMILGALLCANLGPSQAQDRKAEVALQAAIKKEAVDGDLKGAIKAYDKLAKGRDRAVAARALVRMAECYEKLGDTQARTTYERAIRDFGDQKEAVATARARLAALDAGKQDTGVVERVIAQRLGGRRYGPAISRDGRYLAFMGGGVGLHDLATGEVRMILTQQFLNGNYPPLVSPDGKQVAVLAGPGDAPRIHLVSADGTNDRVLTTQGVVLPVNWSPDGRYLAAYEVTDGAEDCNIVLLSLADGTKKIIGLGSVPQAMSGLGFQPRISPDGRFIAFGNSGPRKPYDRNVYIRPVDGGPQAVLAENVAGLFTMAAWTPDGSRLLFTSDEGGSNDLWSLSVRNGRAVGRPERIKKGVGNLLGVTQDGDCIYQLQYDTQDTYVADLDLANVKLAGAPRVLTQIKDWIYPSPDGQSQAYLLHPNGAWSVVVRSSQTGQERTLPLSGLAASLQWFPDGTSMLWQRGDGRLFQLDLRAGSSRQVLDSQINVVYSNSGGTYQRTVILAPDGHTIYFVVRDKNTQQTQVLASDLGGGAIRELSRMSVDIIAGLSISPDGRRLAFLTHEPKPDGVWSLMTLPTGGGEPQRIYTQTGIAPQRAGVLVTGVVWSGDGRRLMFIKRGQPDDVFSVAAEGGEPQPLGIGLHRLDSLDIDPRGKQISFIDLQSENHLSVLKNLFRVPNAASKLDFAVLIRIVGTETVQLGGLA